MCVYVDKSKGISAHLVRNADDYLIHLDTHRALAGMVLEGLANSEKFSEHFSTYLDLTRKNREANNTGNCFLIIMKEGAASLDISRVQRPMENMAYGFELGDKGLVPSLIVEPLLQRVDAPGQGRRGFGFAGQHQGSFQRC